MGIYKDFIIFIIGILVIIKGADFFTTGAEGIAKAFRIPRVIIGLTIVSVATTAPEFIVSTISSHMGVGGMAVGNAVGSCLANIGLILAVAAIIRAIGFNPKVIKQELLFLVMLVIILYLLMLDGNLSFGDGSFLCFLLVVFLTCIILRELKAKRGSKEKILIPIQPTYNIKKDSIRFLIGAAGVVLSAKYAIVPCGINIAHFLGVPEIVIGLSMVALGTSLPELVTAAIASFKKMGDLAAGNIIGANILNILWVLGFSSLINPLNIDGQTKTVTMPVVFFITLLMFLFARTKFKITRSEGLILFVIYAGYIFYILKFAYS
ncbi:calcium/sodium antiporter [bacterium]|nr:calcium/sodium antiporter [bacterium]MCK4325858.1 calcium/sodium antiporter [bacterium]MCK4437195.1 calcium/sodium antiporter [bacterium]